MKEIRAVSAHEMRRFASDLRAEADKHGQLSKRAREMRELAALMESAAAARETFANEEEDVA